MPKSSLLIVIMFVILNGNSQIPQQKIIDRTFVPFYATTSIVVDGDVYSLGVNQAVNNVYPSIIKQNIDLDVEWLTRMYRGVYGTPDDILVYSDILGTNSNEIIGAGSYGNTGGSFYRNVGITKFNLNGNVLWQRDIETVGTQYMSAVLSNSEDGCLAIGVTYPTGLPSYVTLVNVNNMGDTLWTKKITSQTASSLQYPKGYARQNGEFTLQLRDGYDSQFLNIDALGNLLSVKKYVDGNGSTIRAQKCVYDGQYTYVAGRINGGNWHSIIMKLDQNGDVLWCKNYPEISTFGTLIVTNSGDIIANGLSTGGQFINQVQIVKVDSEGNPLKAMTYGQLPASHTLYSDIIEVVGNYLLTGRRQYQTIQTAYQLMIDEELFSGSCYERAFEVTAEDLSITAAPGINLDYISLHSDIINYTIDNDMPVVSGASLVDYRIDNIIETDITLTGDDCGGLCIGKAEISAIGGDPSYSYEWSNGQIGSVATDLCIDEEIVALTGDQLGCYVYDTIIVPQAGIDVPICIVTVDESSTKNVVVWEKPSINTIEGFRVYREVQGNYSLIGYVEYDELSQFVDETNNVNPNITSYRYKISVIDTCGFESELSAHHETIHVTVTEGIGGENNLIWDNYEGFDFVNYNILKDTTDNGLDDFYVADQVSDISFTWSDLNPEDYVNYIIAVEPDATCTSTIRAQDHNASRSNKSSNAANIGETNGIFELSENDFIIFPNPNKGDFTIKFNLNNQTVLDFEIIDFAGKMILNESISANIGENIESISLENLNTGVYVLRIFTESGLVNKRFAITE